MAVASDLAVSLKEGVDTRWAEIKSMHAMLTEEKRSFTVDEQTKFDNIHKALDADDARLRQILKDEQRMRDTDAAYNEVAGRPRTGSGLAGVETREVQQLNEEIRALSNGERARPVDFGWDNPMFSRSRMGKRMAMNMPFYGNPLTPTEARTLFDNYVAGGSPGSFSNPSGAGIVPIDFYDQLISYLVEVSGIMQTGPSVLNTTGGEPIQIPIVAQHTGQVSTGGVGQGSNLYVNLSAAQGGTFATGDPVFSQKTLTSNKFGILVQIARELIDDSGVNLLGYLAMSAGRAVGNNIGNALINSSAGSVGGITNGILTAPIVVTGSSTTAASFQGGGITGSYQGAAITGAPTYANLVTMQYSVIAPYRQSKSCYWLAADQTLGTLRQLTDTTGRPVWEPSTVLGAPDLLLGKPIVSDPFMPSIGAGTSSIAFGDFSQYFVRLVGGMRFERSDDFAFGTDLVSFRAVVRADGNLMNPSATAFPRSQPIVLFKGGAN